MLRITLAVLVLAASIASSARAQAPVLPAAPATSRGVVSSGYAVELLWPAAPPRGATEHPVARSGHDFGLISGGIVLLSLGMLVGVAIASVDAANGGCRDYARVSSALVDCGSEPFALIPIAGAALVGGVAFHGHRDDAWPFVAGLIAAAPQLFGLVLLLIGVHGQTYDILPRARIDGIALRAMPMISTSVLGLELGLSL